MNDDAEQPLTLEQWIERQRAELAAMRAQAHRDIDAAIDRMQRRSELEAICIGRDMAETPIN